MRKLIALVMACAALSVTPAWAETLTNDSVVAMSKAGLGAESIVAKIRNSATKFDLSTDGLVALKQQNVPDPVIAAMLNASSGPAASQSAAIDSGSPDPLAQHGSGIYLMVDRETGPRMQRIDALASSQVKTTGILGYAFTYGIAKVNIKTVLPNATARVVSSTKRPVFYFYFDQSNMSLSRSAPSAFWGGSVTSPNEFTLERLQVTGGHREAVLGQFNITGLKAGVMDKARVDFGYEDVSPGVFKVVPKDELEPGEYGFIYSTGAGGGPYGGAQNAKIFDFSIP